MLGEKDLKLNTSLENIKKYQLINYKTFNKNYQSYKYNFNELMNYVGKKKPTLMN